MLRFTRPIRPVHPIHLRRLLACLALLGATGAAGATTAGCGQDGGLTAEIPEACNPLGGVACITPWPSSVYIEADGSTATGVRVEIGAGALPSNVDGRTIDSALYNGRDGFSFAAPMIHVFPGGVDDSNLPHFSDYGQSLSESSPTVLIDMSTGERIAHFAELDLAAADKVERQALYIRPATRLKGGTRYLVAIRNSLKAAGGGEIPLSPGFAAILSGEKTDHPGLEKIRPSYDLIFSTLEDLGISRDELVVAWDYTTASDQSMRRDVLVARDRALPEIGDAGEKLGYEVTRKDENGDPRIRWEIQGEFDAPLFLTLDGRFNFATTIARDANGEPEYQGLYRSPFHAIIPECAYESANQPVGIIIYGHGLFGSADEVGSGSQRKAAIESCRIVIGTDMRGMSDHDVGNTAFALNDLNKSREFFTIIVQGVVNTIALEHIVRGPMAKGLFVDDVATTQSLVDTSEDGSNTDVVYYGNSQGHVFGSTFLAYDPFITRGAVGVGGANYSMMLERSSDWPTYGVILAGAYPDALDQAIGLNLIQMFFDLTDPVGTSNDMLTGLIPGTPPKQVLMHMAVGDHQVPNITTEYQARSLGIPVMGPSPYVPYGLSEASNSAESALVIWDNGQGSGIQRGNVPPVGTEDPHSMPRNQPAAIRQMTTFWRTGEIRHACGDTACFCLDGACD